MIGNDLFSIGGVTLSMHGLGMVVAFLLAMWLSVRLAKKQGFNPDLVYDFMTYAMIGGVLGARLWYVLLNIGYYGQNPAKIFAVWQGGLAIQGGILGGILVGFWFAKKRKISAWEFADLLAPGLILGMAIGRIGDFLAGGEYGIVSETFGFVYQQPGTETYIANGPVPLIPTVLYEAVLDLMIMWFLLAFKSKKMYVGFRFLWMLILYSIVRFLTEFIRGDSILIFFDLRSAQVTSVVTIIIAVAIIIRRNKQISMKIS
ncbi:prolipoprotein diacylglyceryl transferase [Aquibacillus salsiterrae]|uniref:Phosphatidylglycerol--prolipoprotein diacylglyceryl transferase n=1 Tax=Aquibacillus salsiterrae TaxID=2950439 RepID=A0A9X3WCL4_9BACI|nr:prolipoprotein diacylglyceryl transferase [Aquibacillus salsiterrae]MDC3415911.1 prolipoprotein diacylglyceryl transferase [Aquibacillus salsiterrae]